MNLRPRKDSEGSESSCSSISSTRSNKRRRNFEEKGGNPAEKRAKSVKQKKSERDETMADDDMKKSITKLLQDMNTVLQNTNATNTKLDDQEKKLSSLITDVTAIKTTQEKHSKKIKNLENTVTTLRNDLIRLSSDNNQLQQKVISRDIVIFGLPKLANGDLSSVISSLSAKLNIAFTSADFANVRTSFGKDKNHCIVNASFYNEAQKDLVIQKFRASKPIYVEDVIQLGQNNPMRGKEIFIRSNLTAVNNEILKEARKNKDEIRFAWEKNGRILIRAKEKSPAVEIRSLEQLQKIIAALKPVTQHANSSSSDMDEN